MSQPTKDILFYSNFCNYSKDVINIITKHNIRNQFMFVCVDNKKYNIPEFIDRVPSILKLSGEVFMDEHINNYLELKKKTSNNNIEEISPMTSMYGNSLYSTNFSTIDGAENESMDDNRNFLFIGRDQRMIQVEDDKNMSSKKGGESAQAFEKLMESRKHDDAFIKQSIGIKN